MPKDTEEKKPYDRFANFKGKAGSNNPFKKGVVMNPHGRPPLAKAIPDILRKIGDAPAPESILKELKAVNKDLKTEGMTNRDAMLHRAYYDAEKGIKDARDFVAERTEGKIREYIDLTTNPEDNRPIEPLNLEKLTSERIKLLRGLTRDIIRKRSDPSVAA